jgi:hypothetical protein
VSTVYSVYATLLFQSDDYHTIITRVLGTVDGCVLVWGFGGGLDASPRRFSPEPFLVLPFTIHGAGSTCTRVQAALFLYS